MWCILYIIIFNIQYYILYGLNTLQEPGDKTMYKWATFIEVGFVTVCMHYVPSMRHTQAINVWRCILSA